MSIAYTRLKRGWLWGLLTPDRNRLEQRYSIRTGIATGQTAVSGPVVLGPSGRLTIQRGFEWDGASGPTVDTGATMEASLVHDALYGLLADGLLEPRWKTAADALLWRLLRENGVGSFRAGYWLRAVDLFGGSHLLEPKPQPEAAS